MIPWKFYHGSFTLDDDKPVLKRILVLKPAGIKDGGWTSRVYIVFTMEITTNHSSL